MKGGEGTRRARIGNEEGHELTSRTAPLTDPHGRRLRKLRVQLTDACNFRCFYCMPDAPKFLPKHELLTPEEFETIVANLIGFGVEEIRLTGGEPTLRHDFSEIARRLGKLGARRVGLTTNGFRLQALVPALKLAGVTNVNVSVDSLKPERFREITRTGDLAQVLAGVRAARDAGLEVKLNALLLKGWNDDELLDFVHFSEEEEVEVRFLEYMRIGPQYAAQEDRFWPADEAIAALRQATELEPVPVPADATAFVFRTPGGGRVGIIASETKAFCGSCSRLRLTATGKLRSCLMSQAGVDLRHQPLAAYPALLARCAALKPTGRLHGIEQAMHEIGG